MTPIINTRRDLDALQGTNIYAQALQTILGSTTTWVNEAPKGDAAQWKLVSVNDTLQYLDLTLEELLSECSAAGIVPTTPQIPIDSRFYDTQVNQDGSFTAVAKDLSGLKSSWATKFKHTAYTLLLPSDWLIVRKQEIQTDIPAEWSSYRDMVRSTCTIAIADAENAADIDAFITAVTSVVWPVSPDNQPIAPAQ